MPAAKVMKPTLVEAQRNPPERTRPLRAKASSDAQGELRVPAVRRSRASSCQRGATNTSCPGPQGAACERRARSTSAAPRPGDKRTRTDPRHPAANLKGPAHREQRGVTAEAKHTSLSHKAFTVIPPNPKKRREIQRKAEAELAALEELRLSRAMAYVSINPSSVGGCMSLEEVRLKQQQEMIQAKRKLKPMKKQLMEETPVLTS